MRSNLYKYNKERLFRILSGIPAVVLSLFIPRDKKLIIFNSIHNVEFSGNSKYVFLYFLKNRKERVLFVINDDDVRRRMTAQYGPYFFETNSFKGKMTALRAKTWFISGFDLPVGGIFLSLTHTVIHMTHGSLIKNVGLLEKNLSFIKRIYYAINRTNISYSVSSAPFFKSLTSQYTGLPENKIIVAGYPRNDGMFIFTPAPLLCGSNKKILYAPTWRHDKDVALFAFKDFDLSDFSHFLQKLNIIMYLRLHPHYENCLPQEMTSVNNICIFSGKEYFEIMDYINQFDMLITDYSSIYYDYMILDRPMMFLTYDEKDFAENPGFAVPFNDFTPGYKPQTYIEFKQNIEDAFSADMWKERRHRVNALCNIQSTHYTEDFIKTLIQLHVLPAEN